MTVAITHDFVSPIADAPESPDEVTPSRWNAPHVLTQAEGSLLGRVDSGVGPTTELTPAEVRTLLNVADGATAVVVSDVAYDATTWNGNTDVPTKNAIRDKIEAMAGGGTEFDSTFETLVTDNTTPAAISGAVFKSNITTDGSGLPQAIELPTMAASDIGLRHAIFITAYTDPADTVIIAGPSSVSIPTLQDPYTSVLFEWDGGVWVLAGGLVITPDAATVLAVNGGGYGFAGLGGLLSGGLPSGGPWQRYVSGADGLTTFSARDSNDLATFEDLDFAVSITVNNGVYLTNLTSAGSGSVETFDAGFSSIVGQRHLITYVGQPNPGDIPSISAPSAFRLEGITPSTIKFAQTNKLFYEGNAAGAWNILSAADGMITASSGGVLYGVGTAALYEILDFAISTNCSEIIRATNIISDGSGTTQAFALDSGIYTSQYKSIALWTQTDPGDVPSLDPSNIVDSLNVQPTTINFNVEGDEILLQWQNWRQKWVIIGAAAGVVT